jgi:hypothetical protein
VSDLDIRVYGGGGLSVREKAEKKFENFCLEV